MVIEKSVLMRDFNLLLVGSVKILVSICHFFDMGIRRNWICFLPNITKGRACICGNEPAQSKLAPK